MIAMLANPGWFPKPASTFGDGVDQLFFFLLAVTGFFAVLVFVLVPYFAVKYRRRSASDRPTQIEGSLPLEILWTVIPLCLMLVMFFWGATLFFRQARAPGGATDIYVVGKQWMWKLQHASGRREINELHIPAGRPIRLVMTSEDVIHSFYVPAFRLKQDLVPGRYTSQWFQATEPGRYRLFCAEYCGTEHSRMTGWVYVMEPPDYEKWLSGGATTESMPVAGEKLFQELGCATCHTSQATDLGPSLAGVFGRPVRLQGGATIAADEAYLRESILNPGAKIVSGYENIMPTFQGQIDEEGLLKIVAYIKSLNSGKQP